MFLYIPTGFINTVLALEANFLIQVLSNLAELNHLGSKLTHLVRISWSGPHADRGAYVWGSSKILSQLLRQLSLQIQL